MRYSSLEKCLRLVADRTLDKPYSSRSKALFHANEWPPVIPGESPRLAVARQLRPDVRVVQQTRRGKGNALACGFEAATGDVIAMVDADGSTDPARSRSSCRRC